MLEQFAGRLAVRSFVAWLSLLVPTVLGAAEARFRVQVGSSDVDSAVVRPLRAVIAVPESLSSVTWAAWTDAADRLPAQLTQPGLVIQRILADAPDGFVWREVHWLARDKDPASGWQGEFVIADQPSSTAPEGFSWAHQSDRWAELSDRGRPVMRYMHEPLDKSTPERREETYKVYHHVYDPLGKRLVTKGPGGLYPHHRGLFYGFNRISYDGNQADTWHCNRGEQQAHRATIFEEAGPVLGRHRVAIGWLGREGDAFAEEQREMTAYRSDGGVLIEFASLLTTKLDEVKLDGDPQHAGFQFRASQEVPDSTAKQTYYVRPDGVDRPGQFRNWPEAARHVDLPWLALSMVLGGQRYTAAYLDHPDNPKPARFSERDYGRFGSYFEYSLTPERPLTVNYRIWLTQGELKPASIAELSKAFVSLPSVRVSRVDAN